MREHVTFVSIAVALTVACAVVLFPQHAKILTSDASVETSGPCSELVFEPGWERSIAATLQGLEYTASVYDTSTSCWYELRPEVILTTASAIKLQLVAATLERAEGFGRTLTSAELAAAERTLWFSHNSPPASGLYASVGVSGMTSFSDAVGAVDMEHNAIYGITRTTATDLTRSSLAILHDDTTSPVSGQAKQVARGLLSEVHFTQRWGVSAGLPADHDVWLKNGFFPCTRCGPFAGTYTWRASSTGFVQRPDGSGWAISVLTDGAQTQKDGINAVEAIAGHVSSTLAGGDAATRPFDEANCVTVSAGESATSITARLGLPVEDYDDVRWVSGNEGPLRGQLMCGPEPLVGLAACICPDRTLSSQVAADTN